MGPPFVRPSRCKKHDERAQTEELSFLQEQVGYQLHYYWSNPIFRQSYENLIVKAILANLDYSADRHSSLAELILEQFVLRLLEREKYLESENYRFDFGLANELSVESRLSIRYMFSRLRSYVPYDLREFQQDYLDSHVFWESIERSFLATKESDTVSSVYEIGDSTRRERFRVVKLAELIAAYVDEREVATIVTNVLNRSETEPIDLNLIAEVAQSTNVDLASLFQNTLLQRELPGIYFSAARQAKNTTFQAESHRYSTVLDFRNGEDAPAYVMFEIAELGEHDPNFGGKRN